MIAYDLGQSVKAVEHLEAVATLDPADGRPHRLIGLIYKDMAQDADSEKAYREALRRGVPAGVERDVRLELGEVFVRATKFADGLEVVRGVEPTGKPEDATILAVRAECLRGLGRLPESADLLDKALGNHQTASLLRLRGQVYLDSLQQAEAARCLERAVELGPFDHQSHYLLGQAYSAAGRSTEAARAFARVSELKKNLDRITALSDMAMNKPWDANVRLQLAREWDQMGKPELAQMWRKAAAACSGVKP